MASAADHTESDTDGSIGQPLYLTADIPGIGGRIKQRAEDFLVEELPLYQPVGHGEHLYAMVEKRGMSTTDLVGVLAKHFGVSRRHIGHAGLKDKRAITRQVISVHIPGKKPEDFPSLDHPRVAVLWVDLHTNKLKRGHLAGNRFSIRVRGCEATSVVAAKRVLDELAKVGCPNRIGQQRFGFLGNNHLVGRAMLLRNPAEALDLILSPSDRSPESQRRARERYADGDMRGALEAFPPVYRNERNALRALADGHDAPRALAAIDKTAAGFFISAFQSAVFNDVLERRLESGTIGELVEGDRAWLHNSRRTFAITEQELADEQVVQRLASFEISPSGPMWGSSMHRAAGAVDEAEVEALARFGLDPEQINAAGDLPFDMVGGDRRPLRVPVMSPEIEGGVDEFGPFVRCAFDLPRGSFATTVMDEVMKTSEPDA